MKTYAHVNPVVDPVVAMAIVYSLAGEPVTLRAILRTPLELACAVVIAMAKTNKQTTGSRSKA